jgi:predicted ATP-grasp superfamily ATP-dependent carboligase
VYNSVNKSIHFDLIGLSNVPDHGRFVYENYFEVPGYFNDVDFVIKLVKIIKDNKIDVLYPTMDSVIAFLKEREEILGVPVIGPSAKVATICNSKMNTYNYLKSVVRVPEIFFDLNANMKFPIFAKPNIGYGSRNVKKIDNINQLSEMDLDGVVLCEYLPGSEFTIDCFTGLNNNLLFVGARERSRTMNGISVNTKTSVSLSKRFSSIADEINAKVGFKGAWFFQMKLDENDVPCLLEIACRFAGSSSGHRMQGVNFALANLFLSQGLEPEFIINRHEVELDRALNSIYKINLEFDIVFIDYDDTIVCDGRVNLEAIQLIYKSLDDGKLIYLISRHQGDLNKELENRKLNQLFTHIFHLKEKEKKSDYIKKLEYTRAIFIDDSFSERKDVYDSLNIPVFSVDAVKSLL